MGRGVPQPAAEWGERQRKSLENLEVEVASLRMPRDPQSNLNCKASLTAVSVLYLCLSRNPTRSEKIDFSALVVTLEYQERVPSRFELVSLSPGLGKAAEGR